MPVSSHWKRDVVVLLSTMLCFLFAAASALAAPSISITGTGPASAGSPYTVTLDAVEPVDSWTINWGDGHIDTLPGNPPTASHTYTQVGRTHDIVASVVQAGVIYTTSQLLVNSHSSDEVLSYDGATGDFLQTFGSASSGPMGGTIGPDGMLYVGTYNDERVYRFNLDTGQRDRIINNGSGGISGPTGLALGPDGYLYISSSNTDQVMRYDASTGDLIDIFIPAGYGGLDRPTGLTFGTDGYLYVCSVHTDSVIRYDVETGNFVDTFVSSGSGGLDEPLHAIFGPDDHLYVSGEASNRIHRYHGSTGAFIDLFDDPAAGLDRAGTLVFGPDGNLYAGNQNTHEIARFDQNGDLVDLFVTAASGGLVQPLFMVFTPDHQVLVEAATTHSISGTVFEDADFAGIATAYDGGTNDLGQVNVDVELYDGADGFVTSTTTAADGSYSFTGLGDGAYKIRARPATIGDADTPPAGGLNPTVPGTWPYPLPEMTWGNGSALLGGQDPAVDDTDTGDNAGPGDTYVQLTVSGSDVTGFDLGFAYNLIVNSGDDGAADNTRSDQGSLRQFLKNANAIGTAGGTTANHSRFRIPGAGPHTVSTGSALPVLAETATLDGDDGGGGRVIVDGTTAGNVRGLSLTGSDITVANLVLQNFLGASSEGVRIHDGTDRNTISNCLVQNIAVDGIRIDWLGTDTDLDHAITDCTVSGSGHDGIVLVNVDGISVTNCLIENSTRHGMNLVGANNGSGSNLIAGNLIRGNGDRGISIWDNGCSGNIFHTNIFHSNYYDGLRIGSGGNDTKIYHNVFDNNGTSGSGSGVTVSSGVTGVVARNNLFTSNSSYGFSDGGSGTSTSIDHCGFYGNGTAACNYDCLTGSQNITSDPQYAPPGPPTSFGLTECASPAVDAGVDLGVDQPDLNGSDPGSFNGPGPDLGAIETGCGAVGAYKISGLVFEDVNYGGGVGVDHAAALARAGPFTLERVGVTVELYDSGGNHVSAVSPQTTDASGNYGFTGLTPDSYTVRVVTSSVTSTRAGSDGSELGVQTYRIDGDGEPIGTGASKVGGEVPADEDAAANSGTQTLAALQGTDLDTDAIIEWTQSIVTVDASGGDVTGVDFGFNFDTIVNTNDKDQGSLRQFILNANLLIDQASLAQNGLTAGAETSIFMIPSGTDPLGRPVDAGFDAGRGVAVIAPVSEMEALVDSGTLLDGTIQTVNIGDTNPGILGYAGPVGLGADGVIATGDEPTLSGVAAPEVEFKGNSTLEFGLRLQGNDITLRGFAVYGFGTSGLDANILVGHHSLVTDNTNCRIEANVLGTMADDFVDPGPGVRSPTINIYVRTADQGAIVGNLLGYVGRENVRILSTALNWQVTDNEIRAGGRETSFGGVTFIADATGEIKRNLIADDNATAVLGINTDLVIENNTITGNSDGAIGFFDNSGSRITTASVSLNDMTGNGSGVVVLGENGASPAITEIRISRNRFGGNTWNAIDLAPDWTSDGISVNDGTELGDSSVPNSCGTVLTTGNIGLDTPLIDSAVLSAGTTTIIGRACPGAEIEIYRAVADGDASDTAGGTDYGEGVEYLDTATADGAGDWTIMTTALADGNHVSAIAIDDSGNTSEFGPNLVVTAIGLSGIVFEDADFAGSATDYDGGVADLPLVNVDVELYNGTTDAYMASTTTTTGGIFTFGTLADGIYKVRVRSATIGDADTPPAGGLHPTVPAAWPYPLAEMTWGDGVALVGGQDPDVDDTATGDDAGPGDTWVTVTISGGDVSGVNLGFSYELIVNTADDANADNVRSKQGCLRQFIKNSNAIVGINKSWFQIPSS